MVANCFRLNRSSTLCSTHWNPIKHKLEHPCVVAMLGDLRENITEETRKTNAYNDNFRGFSTAFDSFAGLSNNKNGYESLVEADIVAKHKFDPIQHEVIIQGLRIKFMKAIKLPYLRSHFHSHLPSHLRSRLRLHLRSPMFAPPFSSTCASFRAFVCTSVRLRLRRRPPPATSSSSSRTFVRPPPASSSSFSNDSCFMKIYPLQCPKNQH
ncbi:hypothetical protein ACSQ67_008618 [Phaseolus vulgaris]